MEEPDLGELDGEVREEDEFGAVPLFFDGWDFCLDDVSEWRGRLRERRLGMEGTYRLDLVFAEIGDAVDYYPWEGTAEIDDFVHDKGHDTCCEDIVLHVRVPSLRKSVSI